MPESGAHRPDARPQVMLLPGGVLPADLAYGALIETIGDDAEAVAKELELYAGDTPPHDYSLDHEIAGVVREAGTRGWDRFHLVGYSAGGAAALAFTARHPDRVLSLALLEPAWAGSRDLSPAEEAVWEEYQALLAGSDEDFMEGFIRLELRDGVEPPPPPAGDPPPWMARRPPGLRVLIESFRTYDLSRESLKQFTRPVYFALGALSNPDQYEELAKRLGRVFPDFELEVFEERHHFDPPHRMEPERLADSLRAVWRRAAGQ